MSLLSCKLSTGDLASAVYAVFTKFGYTATLTYLLQVEHA